MSMTKNYRGCWPITAVALVAVLIAACRRGGGLCCCTQGSDGVPVCTPVPNEKVCLDGIAQACPFLTMGGAPDVASDGGTGGGGGGTGGGGGGTGGAH